MASHAQRNGGGVSPAVKRGLYCGLIDRVPARKRGKRSTPRDGTGKRWVLYGDKPEPMPSVMGPLEDPVEPRLGVCCSGGGIRSAAYNLGALQVLQRTDELRRATYLAAV